MPQSNGQAERMVHTIKNSLDRSPGALDVAVAAYNYTPNSAIEEKTPSEVFFGRRLRTPFDVFRPLDKSSSLSAWQQSMKTQFDRHHGVEAPVNAESEQSSFPGFSATQSPTPTFAERPQPPLRQPLPRKCKIPVD